MGDPTRLEEDRVSVEVGSVYKNTTGNMVLLVIGRSLLSARCVIIWTNADVMTAYCLGDVDSWDLKLIEEHWTRVD